MKIWHWIVLITIAVISFIGESTTSPDSEHAVQWWHSIPAFYVFYGFFGCIAIVVFSKALGKWFLQKREDYYDVP